MIKLLNQLLTVLEETNVKINKIEVDYLKYDSVAIRVNEEAYIKFSPNPTKPYYKYSVFSEEHSYSTSSLTEALNTLVECLSKLKTGDMLVSRSEEALFKVVVYLDNKLYNLLDVKNNVLLYPEGKSLEYIYNNHIKHTGLRIK